jgi:hypothetical protein
MFVYRSCLAPGTADLRTSVEKCGLIHTAVRHCGPRRLVHRLSKPQRPMFKTSETIRSTQSPDGTLLLDVHEGRLFSINPTGSKILDLLKEGRNEVQIADEIARSCGVTVESVRSDVHEFIDALRAFDIVTTTLESRKSR